MQDIEVWIVMDADGDYEVGVDKETAVENFENAIGGSAGARIAKVNLKMAPPQVVETDIEIDDDAGEIIEATDEALAEAAE
jgi:hypothetical protein